MGSICNEKLLESGGMYAAVYGCITGEEVRTQVGYSGGSKLNPDNYSIGHHPERIEVWGKHAHSLHTLISLSFLNLDLLMYLSLAAVIYRA
jgi:hypothetical protein